MGSASARLTEHMGACMIVRMASEMTNQHLLLGPIDRRRIEALSLKHPGIRGVGALIRYTIEQCYRAECGIDEMPKLAPRAVNHGPRLQAARARSGYSLTKLAAILETTHQNLARMERDEAPLDDAASAWLVQQEVT